MPMTFLDALKEPIAAFHRHPAMSGSNPFRRKENQLLGLDDSSYISSTTDIASAVARIPDTDSGQYCSPVRILGNGTDPPAASLKGNQKKVRVVSPHLSRTATAQNESEDEDSYHAALSRAGSKSSHARSQYNYQSSIESDNVSPEVSDEEYEYEDDFDGDDHQSRRKGRRLVPYKANQALNVDWDNPWRNSTAMGNFPGTGKHTERNTTAIPPKAQRTLGMSRTGRALDQEGYRRENSLSPETNNVAPKALRTLGIPSNPFQRPSTADSPSGYGEDCDHFSLASAAHRQLDADEFKRLLFSGHRAPPFDNSSSTDVSSNSRSSMLSSQSYRETPRSSHEILPDDMNTRAYSRLNKRPPISIVSSRSGRTDSMVDPKAVLTEPFSPLSSLHPDSPTDLNKPLPQPPKRPETIYELPASFPQSNDGTSKDGFVAELPAAAPIAELADTATSGVAELPSHDIETPVSAASSRRMVPGLPHPRRSGLARAATSDYPTVAELDSPNPVELPDRHSRQGPLHHAKTLPAMHSAVTSAQHPQPARGSSQSKRLDRVIIGGLPSGPSPRQQTYPGPLPNHATKIPRYSQPPPRYSSVVDTTSQSLPTYQSHHFDEKAEVPVIREKEAVGTETATSQPAQSTGERTSTPTDLNIALETSASPFSPSSTQSTGLGSIDGAAVPGTQRKSSTKSLKNLAISELAIEARRKASSASLGAVGSNSEVAADIAALQRDVDSLRHKIGLPSESSTSSSTRHGTPPNGAETGKLGQSETRPVAAESYDRTAGSLEMSEIQKAVQNAADEAVGVSVPKATDGSYEQSTAQSQETNSINEDITPKASDTEEANATRGNFF